MKRVIGLFFVFLFGSGVAFAQESPETLGLAFRDRTLYLHFDLQSALLHSYTTPLPDISTPFTFGFLEDFSQKPAHSYFFIDREKFLYFLTRASVRDQSEKHYPITIDREGKARWIIQGRPYEDYLIDEQSLISRVNEALNTGKKKIQVPYEKSFSRPNVARDIQKEHNIHEVVAIGESNFAGSSEARKKNIRLAAEQFNGVLIRRGETFSFNDLVGDISEHNGYKSENVIKGNTTVKEVGGGVCEVSTAIFRAAFFAGLPILERRNHSLALTNYLPVGLDAAIYEGSKDFRFWNDTKADILIQTFTDDENVYFVLYGEKDSRTVYTEGPFVHNIRDPHAYMVTKGKEPQRGYETTWIRYLSYDGVQQEKEIFSSIYRPWASVVMSSE